jgi:hypothetical protein
LTRCPSGSRKIIERLPQGWVFGGIPPTRHPSRTIADLARATLVLLVGLAAGVAVGFRFNNGILPGGADLALVLAFSYAMSWEMTWIALKVRDPETTQVAGFLPVAPFASSARGSCRWHRCRAGCILVVFGTLAVAEYRKA